MMPRSRSALFALATILLLHAGGMAFAGGGRVEAVAGSVACGLSGALCVRRALRRPERRAHERASAQRGAE